MRMPLTRQRLALLFLLGLLAWFSPLLPRLEEAGSWLGIPGLYLYLFGVWTALVVAAAGVSHGTFYTYFENKAALLDALIDVAGGDLQSVVDAPWEGTDGSSTIAAVIGRFVEVFSEQADVVRVWIEASAHDEHFRTRLQAVRAGYVHRVAGASHWIVHERPAAVASMIEQALAAPA